MADPTDDQLSGGADDVPIPSWDALDVLRVRASEARGEREASIAELRATMADQEALDEFGVDLGEIEG